MPIDSYIALSGTVAPDPFQPPRAALSGWLSAGAINPPTLSGTVSTEVRRSYDGATSGTWAGTIYTGVRVVLAGVDVTADLMGEVTIEDSIDSHLRQATFALEGRAYSPAVTERTWTRSPCQVYFRQGPPGSVREVLELDGYVETCQGAGDGSFGVTAVDAGILYNKAGVCLGVAPHGGLTRGQVCESLAAAAGVGATDIPAGAPWAKPFETAGRRLYELLSELGAPEGWHWRTRPGGVLEAYVPRIKSAPEPADHVWPAGDLLARPQIEPPRDVPSRWLVRGAAAVLIDELGFATEVTKIEVEDIYAPAAAVLEQDSAGVITPVTFYSPAIPRVVSRINDQVTRRGGRVERQSTVEHGWYNPPRGKWSTDGPGSLGAGPIGTEGYYYKAAYIDADGGYRAWTHERFIETGRRDQDYFYNDAGDLTGITVATRRHRRERRAVRRSTSTTADIAATDVGDDDMSYSSQIDDAIESYDLAEVQQAAYVYDPSGPAVLETLDSQTVMSPRAAIDPTQNHFILADGTAQEEITATLQLSHRQQRQHLVDSSGRLKGQVDREYEYVVRPVVGGPWDFGDVRANRDVARFRQSHQETREIQVLDADSYLVVVYTGGRRQETRHMGQPPLPRYLKSPWTALIQQPFEVIVDDPVLEAWFGFERRVIADDYVQSSAEARAMIERRLSRLLAHRLTVRRAETAGELGDTVLVSDPLQGIALRALIVARRRRRVPLTGEASAEYTMESPLPI